MISLFSKSKLLRVLDIKGRPIKGKLTREIGNLKHLRYLRVDCSEITKISSSIGNLKCLQTLVLEGNGNEVNVPNVIWKMVQLRHLDISEIVSRSGKLRLGDLSNLQTLRQFNIRNFNVEELSKLTNLRKLVICATHSEELEEIPRVNFNRLCSLKIELPYFGSPMKETDLEGLFLAFHKLYNLFRLYLRGEIVKLPKNPQFPKNLTNLTLDGSRLVEDPMPTLEKLPYLTILRLDYQSFMGKEMVCSSKFFPQLKFLLLSCLPQLKEWRVGEEAAMPNLSHLRIHSCPKLKKIPNGLRFITTLRKLEISAMDTDFRNRLEQDGEDYDKFRHVPSITFKDMYDW